MDLDDLLAKATSPATPLLPADKATLLSTVEREIDAYSAFLALPVAQGGCGQDPLIPMERALVRTYLVARMTGRFPSVLAG